MGVEDMEAEEIYSFDSYSCRAYRIGSGDENIAFVTENHGDEKGPRRVLDEMFEDGALEYEDLKLTVIEKTNAYASEATRRKTPLDIQKVEADEHDMNRMYGKARRTLETEKSIQSLNTTGQLAHQVLDYIDNLDPDLVVDMHTGASATVKMPQIRYKFREDYGDVSEKEMRAVAENAGVDIVKTIPEEDAQMIGAVLPKMGFPTVTVEAGGGVRLGWGTTFDEEDVENYRDIIENILEFRAEGTETDYLPEEFTSIEKNHAPMNVSKAEVDYHFDLGDKVKEGDRVATLSFEDGEVEMAALSDGVLETVLAEDSRDNTRHGNRIFNIATRQK